jgi:hypothetical protein
MAIGPKDPQIEQFLMLYRRLQDWVDQPSQIEPSVKTDEPLKQLCLDLFHLENRLSEAEKEGDGFAAPVGVDFTKAWREYELQYANSIAAVALKELIGDFDLEIPKSEKTQIQARFETAEVEARDAAKGIELIFEFATDQVIGEWSTIPDDFLEEGLGEWDKLRTNVGFDLAGIFRRRKLIPFVLIPPHISNKYGAEQISLFSLLREAHKAFVWGVPMAAVGLMRAILELVLSNHYGTTGDLENKIDTASVEPGISKLQMHKLRKLANSILHVEVGRTALPHEIEMEIVSHLLLLRMLIEKCPSKAAIRP